MAELVERANALDLAEFIFRQIGAHEEVANCLLKIGINRAFVCVPNRISPIRFVEAMYGLSSVSLRFDTDDERSLDETVPSVSHCNVRRRHYQVFFQSILSSWRTRPVLSANGSTFQWDTICRTIDRRQGTQLWEGGSGQTEDMLRSAKEILLSGRWQSNSVLGRSANDRSQSDRTSTGTSSHWTHHSFGTRSIPTCSSIQ